MRRSVLAEANSMTAPASTTAIDMTGEVCPGLYSLRGCPVSKSRMRTPISLPLLEITTA
jgi:hypothetical protein